MNGDSYKIIISLSHHRIAYEYWQRDGENKLVPMPNGAWPAPLAFYCSENGIIIGEDAARAAHTGTSNAFENYFELLVEDRTYSIGGQNRPIRNLLLDASESIFRDFFRNVLFNRFGSLSDNRSNMPLTLVCESDIKPNERALLYGLFKDSGYTRVRVAEYEQYIARYIKETISKEYVCDKVLVTWTEGTNLTFTLFDVNGNNHSKQKTYDGLGIDPRKGYVKKLIWDRVIGQNPWLMKENEEEAISKAASDFLCSSVPMINDTILLSDGQKYYYSLNRNNIDYIQNSDGVSIKDKLDDFLRSNDTYNRGRVLLLLRGIAAGNTYFEQNLSQGFSKVIRSDQKLRDNTMRLLLSEENPKPVFVEEPPKPPSAEGDPDSVLKAKKKRWRIVRAEVKGKIRGGQTAMAQQILKDFLSECEPISGAEDLLSEINEEFARIAMTNPSLPEGDSEVKRLEREWREIKATAKGKSRSGNISEAVDILKSFAQKAGNVQGTEDLMVSINSELSSLTETSKSSVPKHKDGGLPPNGKWKAEKKSKIESAHTGQTLVLQGRLKEARDWYRGQNENNMARILSDIIRSQKGVEMRKNGIAECRKTKNKDQISRIINEIQDFIELCEKVCINTSEYKKLLSEYKKL